MDAPVTSRGLKQLDRATTLLRGKTAECLRGADKCAKWHVRRPVAYVGDVSLDPIPEPSFVSRVHHPLERVYLTVDCCHIAAVSGEVERSAIDVPTRNEHL